MARQFVQRLSALWPIFLVFTACVGFTACSERPAGVPADAEYVGTWKDGVWITCDLGIDTFCEIYNSSGRLYLKGAFERADEVSACTRAYTAIIFPLGGEFLVPVDVEIVDADIRVMRASSAENLSTDISRAIGLLHGKAPTQVLLGQMDSCGDGTYKAVLEKPPALTGRIWAEVLFEVSVISRDADHAAIVAN